MTQAYITGVGAYLPGDPVDNEQLAAQFGDGNVDVPLAVYEHAVLCECAHARLGQSARAGRPARTGYRSDMVSAER
jgi:3-oxoacyl-[acyl-carrier-protein] synthase III